MNRIYFISDLHLDRKYDNSSDKFFDPKQSKRDRFIDLLKQHKDDTIIIMGDFYNDYLESIKIIKEIDDMGINGFWTFGNHEWLEHAAQKISDPKESTREEFETIKQAMYDLGKQCENFKLLATGIVENIKDYVIIGDVGWTSFIDNKSSVHDNYEYDWKEDWNFAWVKEQNKKWLTFANKVLKENMKVIIATHYPMYLPDSITSGRFAGASEEYILYWFSKNDFVYSNEHKVIFLHGHTHDKSLSKGHYTNPIGRKGNSFPLQLQEIEIH